MIDPKNPPPTPAQWTGPEEPPYAYWMYYMHVNLRSKRRYYMHANLRALNALRVQRDMSTFEFR